MYDGFVSGVNAILKALTTYCDKPSCMGCHARMHNFMHDGRLRACPSYLLGLLYGCKVMNVLK
jgi:hypothetical protein